MGCWHMPSRGYATAHDYKFGILLVKISSLWKLTNFSVYAKSSCTWQGKIHGFAAHARDSCSGCTVVSSVCMQLNHVISDRMSLLLREVAALRRDAETWTIKCIWAYNAMIVMTSHAAHASAAIQKEACMTADELCSLHRAVERLLTEATQSSSISVNDFPLVRRPVLGCLLVRVSLHFINSLVSK